MLDKQRVTRERHWNEDRFRYAAASSLRTEQHGAALRFEFVGTGVAVRLGGHNVPSYGSANLGRLVAHIDGRQRHVLIPRETPREIVLADNLSNERHKLRIEHQAEGELSGCRVEGFRVWTHSQGSLRFSVTGEANAFLVDVRAVLTRNLLEPADAHVVVREALLRNWLTGQCSMTALPPGDGYALELSAIGWQLKRVKGIKIKAGGPTVLEPVFLKRDTATVNHRFRFPALNRPAIRRPGGSFRARFLGFDATIDEVLLERRAGPAVILRSLDFEEDESAAFYYDREIVAHLPETMPAGAYDLTVRVTGGRRTGVCRSPRSVHVVPAFPSDPVFVTFGHLDTSAEYQAEYLQRLATMINLLSPDMVLVSNAANPAYVSGALSRLDMPYVINFGNHQFSGHEAWYGDPVGLVDLGPDVSILNFGHPWHMDKSKADALLASRSGVSTKIINAFEHNSPLGLLDRHRVRMIHDAHGTGKKVMDMGATPTRRIGKVNAVSFRVVRFRNNRVASCTYNGHETAPIPFGREQTPPLRASFAPANDGTHRTVTATVTNEFLETFPKGRLTFVMPKGDYQVDHGAIESRIASDDDKLTVLNVRTDVLSQRTIRIRVAPK